MKSRAFHPASFEIFRTKLLGGLNFARSSSRRFFVTQPAVTEEDFASSDYFLVSRPLRDNDKSL